jgi:hypothetical protein
MTPKRPRDPNQLANAILDSATGQVEERSLHCRAPDEVFHRLVCNMSRNMRQRNTLNKFA